MDFTFGIITNGSNDEYINIIIESIKKNNIPNYEIIIVGNTTIMDKGEDTIRIFNFDESIKPGWITRKKNIITENAKYDNVVLLHDYIKFNDDWYEGFLKYGEDYQWCITPIVNIHNVRFRDYTLYPYNIGHNGYSCISPAEIDEYFNDYCLLPYHFENNLKINKYMYISGSYYVIKKSIANMFPLDENLGHCQGEDVEYSKRLNNYGIIIKCNPNSKVTLLKEKYSFCWEREINNVMLEKLINH